MKPEYDGVAEVWLASEENQVEAMSSPKEQHLSEPLLKDEQNFIDHSRSSAFTVRGHEFDD